MKTYAVEDLVARYGRDYEFEGVLTEHLRLAPDAVVRNFASGRQVIVGSDGRAHFTCCSEVIAIDTEDGPMSGRCGGPVFGDDGACRGHQAMIDSWRAQSEIETIAWERDQERVA